jgi:hypothetical protein
VLTVWTVKWQTMPSTWAVVHIVDVRVSDFEDTCWVTLRSAPVAVTASSVLAPMLLTGPSLDGPRDPRAAGG